MCHCKGGVDEKLISLEVQADIHYLSYKMKKGTICVEDAEKATEAYHEADQQVETSTGARHAMVFFLQQEKFCQDQKINSQNFQWGVIALVQGMLLTYP